MNDHGDLLEDMIAAGPTALRTLVRLLDANGDAIRLRAADSLAKLALQAGEQANILARLDALEQREGSAV